MQPTRLLLTRLVGTNMARPIYVRVAADTARTAGLDWTSRNVFFKVGSETRKLLASLIEEMDETLGKGKK